MPMPHMQRFGTTVEHFGEVAVACREHALLNDNAIMSKPMTLEDHRNSRLVAEPFRRFDCSLESDGGTEVIASATERAADLRQPQVFISGVAAGHPDSPASITQRPDMTSLGLGKAVPVPSALLAPYWED